MISHIKMKRDLILSAIIAAGVHVLILLAVAPRAGFVHGGIHKSIILSIVRPPKAVVPTPPAKRPSGPVSRPHLSPKQKPVPAKAVIPKKKLSAKKRLAAKPPVKESKVGAKKAKDVRKEGVVTPESVEHLAEKSIESTGKAAPPSSAEKAPVQGHNGHDALRKGKSGAGTGAGGIITYAKPKYKEGARPVYPKVAQRRGYEGRVLLEVEILETGEVDEVKIVASSGFRVLDKEAVRWVNTNPFLHGPNREKRTYLVPVVFNFDEEKILARGKRK